MTENDGVFGKSSFARIEEHSRRHGTSFHIRRKRNKNDGHVVLYYLFFLQNDRGANADLLRTSRSPEVGHPDLPTLHALSSASRSAARCSKADSPSAKSSSANSATAART